MLELFYNTTKISSGQDIYFLTYVHEQLALTDVSLQGVIQVSMCCPSNNQAPEPQLPMKQLPKQGTNYSSPQQGKKKKLVAFTQVNTPTSF